MTCSTYMRGFTLIELMVVMVLMSVVLAFVSVALPQDSSNKERILKHQLMDWVYEQHQKARIAQKSSFVYWSAFEQCLSVKQFVDLMGDEDVLCVKDGQWVPQVHNAQEDMALEEFPVLWMKLEPQRALPVGHWQLELSGGVTIRIQSVNGVHLQ